MPDLRELRLDSANNDGDLRSQGKENDVPKYTILGMKGRKDRIKRGREVVNLRDSRAHEKHRARWPIIRGHVNVSD